MTIGATCWTDYIAASGAGSGADPVALSPQDVGNLDDDNLDAGIALMREAGLTTAQIAEALHMTAAAVVRREAARRKKRWRHPPEHIGWPPDKPRLSPTGWKIVDLAKAGLTQEECAAKTGTALATVSAVVSEARRTGLLRADQGCRTQRYAKELRSKQLRRDVLAAWSPKATYPELAAAAGCCATTARTIVEAAFADGSLARPRQERET